jgi:very-short-patch-repair endonuclease
MTLPEVLLWQQLRGNETGHHWRKQHPAGSYILDFYCDAAKLCIEIDGEAHERGDRPQKDVVRDRWLAAQGVLTLRIAAVEVLGNMSGVLAYIAGHARRRAPLHRPLDGPPPPAALGQE